MQRVRPSCSVQGENFQVCGLVWEGAGSSNFAEEKLTLVIDGSIRGKMIGDSVRNGWLNWDRTRLCDGTCEDGETWKRIGKRRNLGGDREMVDTILMEW